MAEAVTASKKLDGEKTTNIEHVLDPETFIKLFTKEGCTNEEKLMQEILQPICALRNSGGGKLTIWLKKTCSAQEIEKCAEIIINAAESALSNTKRTDCIKGKCMNRLLIFSILGSQEVVTMNYNMYIVKNNEVKLVPPTKSAAKVRFLLHKRKGESVIREKRCDQVYIVKDQTKPKKPDPSTKKWFRRKIVDDQTRSKEKPDPRAVKCVQRKIVDDRTRSKEGPDPRAVECVQGKIVVDQTISKKEPGPRAVECVQRKIVHDQTRSKEEPGPKAVEWVQRKTVEDQTGSREKPGARAERFDDKTSSEFYPSPNYKDPPLPVTLLQGNNPKAKYNAKLLNHEGIVQGDKIETPTTSATVKFKMLKDKKFYTDKGVAHCLSRDEYELLQYVCAFANHRGGELYYGITSNGTVYGEKLKHREMGGIRQTVKEKIESMVWPTHVNVDDIQKLWKICFIPVTLPQEDAYPRFVIKISVDRCPGGVFVKDPESYYVVRNRVVKLPFPMWIARLEDSTVEISDKIMFGDFEESKNAFDRLFLRNDYQAFLERLEWVQSFKVVDENEDCDVRHLEIVCKFGSVPRKAEIMNYFGEDILPFITYKEISKREWFEANIFDENYDMKEEYEDYLINLPWVKEFYIGVAREPEKSWQIYITCATNKVPSMVDLKKLFGVEIASFVDFIQENADEDSKDNEESRSASYLRGPISGDELRIQGDTGNCGTIGILTAAVKHYATTCYHVCYTLNDVTEDDIEKDHKIYKQDSEAGSPGCIGTRYVYGPAHGQIPLGQFHHGLYDDDHDIALIELDESLNCADMLGFITNENIKPVLAGKQEVAKLLFDTVELPVEIIRTETKHGTLFAPTGRTKSSAYKHCYRVKATGETPFAEKGDSGSLVYLVYNREKIPFAYLCMRIPDDARTNVYYCRNLSNSIEKLLRRHTPCLRQCDSRQNNNGLGNI